MWSIDLACKALNSYTVTSNGGQDPTLFSSIRAEYQSIVETLLERENPADPNLDLLKARHRSGEFFCRYQSCPRSTRGYESSQLRQVHEVSHGSRFQCTNPACNSSGRNFGSRAALNKHNAQCNDDADVSSIKISLFEVGRHTQEYKARFTLKEPSITRRDGSPGAMPTRIRTGLSVSPTPSSPTEGIERADVRLNSRLYIYFVSSADPSCSL